MRPLTPVQVNQNLTLLRSAQSDLIQQAVDDNSLSFTDVGEAVQLFEGALVQAGASADELQRKKHSFSIAVQTAVLTAATEWLSRMAKRSFIFPQGEFQAKTVEWLSKDAVLRRPSLFVRARYPRLDLSKVLLVVAQSTSSHDKFDSYYYQYAKKKEPLWVEATVTYLGVQVTQKVKVSVVNLSAIQEIFLQQVFGAKQVLVIPAAIYAMGATENPLQRDAALVYRLVRVKQQWIGMDEAENYPLGRPELRRELENRIQEMIRVKEWEPKVKGLGASIRKWLPAMANQFQVESKLDALFNRWFQREWQKMAAEESIQSLSEVVRFLRGQRLKREEILTVLEGVQPKKESPAGAQPSPQPSQFPSLQKEFYAAIVDG